jgi:methylenetetrahydrofolate reductase (NADPH)
MSRYEILPFGSGVDAAMAEPEPLTVTITCSPRHGIDRTVELAERLAAHGHRAVPHLAARKLRSPDHLGEVLVRLHAAGVDDVFLVGGDGPEPEGPWQSALALLPELAEHPWRPARIGIGAYPEGHPLITPDVLQAALAEKALLADYLVTQLCFDPAALLAWLAEARAAGVSLPAYVGVPGLVDRRKLMEISLRVGVGPSVTFLRKQRGLRRLLGSPAHAAAGLHAALAPRVGDPALGIAGLHWYTFNQLRETVAWERAAGRVSRSA